MEGVWRYTPRPWSSEFEDALGGCDQVSLEMHLEAIMVRDRRSTWRVWLSKFGDELGGRDWASSEMHLQAMMEWDRTGTWRWSMDGAPGAENLFTSYSTRIHGNVTGGLYIWVLVETWSLAVNGVDQHAGRWNYSQGSTRNHANAGKRKNLRWMLYSVYAVLGVCCTWCMLYLVYAVLGVCCTWCMLYLMYAVHQQNVF